MTRPTKARTIRQMEGDMEIMSAHVDRLTRDLRELTGVILRITTVTNELSVRVHGLLAEMKENR